MRRSKTKFILLMALLTVLFSTLTLKSSAYEDVAYSDDAVSKIIEKKYDVEEENNYDSTFDFDGFRVKHNPVSSSSANFKVAPASSSREDIALNDLIFRIFLLAFISVGFLILMKIFLLKKKLPEQEFNFSGMDFLNNPFDSASKPGGQMGSLLNAQGLTLKQSLNLTASQSVNLVEVDGKKLLIGCTQQGGVQLLADLSESAKPLQEKDPESENLLNLLKKLVKNNEEPVVDENKSSLPFSESISDNPFLKSRASSTISASEASNDLNQEIIVKDIKDSGSDVYSFQEMANSRRPFRRRPSYRESLSVYTVR